MAAVEAGPSPTPTPAPTPAPAPAPTPATAGSSWLRRVVRARYAQLALFWFSFLEATALPIPVETVMIPYMQMRRDILWRLPLIALAGFMCSALLGFGVGSLLYDTAGAPFIAWMGWGGHFDAVQAHLARDGFWAMLAVAVVPLPTQVVMIGAGSIGVPLETFIAALVLARGLRYFGAALLVHLYGERVVDWLARRAAARAQRRRPRR